MENKPQKIIILFLPIFFLLVFLILPLLNLLRLSLSFNNQLSIQNFINVINYPLNSYFLIWNLYQAIITTILAIIIGLPFSFLLYRYQLPGKSLIRSLVTIPFLLPPIVVLMSFITVFGTGGWINELWQSLFHIPFIKIYGTTEGIVLAHLFYNIPVIIRLSEIGFYSLNPELETVSKSLGVSRFRYYQKVVFPHIMPSLLTAALLVFIYSFNSFAIVLILGGVRLQTLEVRIYSLAKYAFDYNQAAALTMIQLGINFLVIISYFYLSSKTEVPIQISSKNNLIYKRKLKISIRKIIELFFFGIVFILVSIICLVPLLGLFYKSFLSSGSILTLGNYQNLLNNKIKSFIGLEPQQMIINTTLFGILVLITAMILSLLLNYGLNYETTYRGTPKLDPKHITGIIVILPLIVSSISLAFSIFSLYRETFFFEQTGMMIVIAHVLIAFPFANRIIASGRANIDRNYIIVGRSLGLTRFWTFIRIELPILVPYIVIAGLFSLAISIGEFGATNFISKGDYITIPVGIYRLINTRHLGEATSFSVILILVTLLLFYIIEKIGKYDFKI